MKVLLILLTSILFYFSYLINGTYTKPYISISKQDTAINIDEEVLSIFNLGQKRLISSILWVQTLLESDIDHYKGKDENSWMFRRFRSIAKIDPKFYQNYLYGGQYLSIIKDDDKGAKIIYDLGVAEYPDDFWLRYHAGFHYYFELGDSEGAYKHFSRIQDHEIARRQLKILPTITARIKAGLGDLDTAFELVENAYDNTPKDSAQKERLFKLMVDIRAEIDLNCLNLGKLNCNKKDIFNNNYKYSKETNSFYATYKWDHFRIHKKKKASK